MKNAKKHILLIIVGLLALFCLVVVVYSRQPYRVNSGCTAIDRILRNL